LPINLAQLSGILQERGALRRTPAGVAVLDFSLMHESMQIEASVERKVDCEMDCVAIGNQAQILATVKPGAALTVSGFLAARSLKRKTPVLHVNTIEFVEGN
jgi:primosomal replication protein N